MIPGTAAPAAASLDSNPPVRVWYRGIFCGVFARVV